MSIAATIIKDCGYKNVFTFINQHNLPYSQCRQIITGEVSAATCSKNNRTLSFWKGATIEICAALDRFPEEVFPEALPNTFIDEESTEDPMIELVRADLKRKITRVLVTLTPREERVTRLRFGIGFEQSYTCEEIAEMFKVSRERIRQIETKALRKLKHPDRSRILRSFLDY